MSIFNWFNKKTLVDDKEKNDSTDKLFNLLYGFVTDKNAVESIWNEHLKSKTITDNSELAKSNVKNYLALENFIVSNNIPITVKQFDRNILRSAIAIGVDVKALPETLQIFFSTEREIRYLIFKIATIGLCEIIKRDLGTQKVVDTYNGAVSGTILEGVDVSEYGVGLVVWTYFNIFLNVKIPSPSIADLFFIVIFLPTIAYGFLNIITIFSASITKKNIIEGLTVLLLTFVITFGFANKPVISPESSVLTNLTSMAYPLIDSIILGLAIITLRVGAGRIKKGGLLLLFGFIFQILADFAFTYTVTQNTYWNGNVADLAFAIGAFIISLGMITLYYDFTTHAFTT